MSFDFIQVGRSSTYATKYDDRHKKFGREDLLPLWVADMDLASPPCVQEALHTRAAHPLYGYTTYPKRYFDAIVSWYEKAYGWRIDPEWIIPCYGVVPSMNFAIEAYSTQGEGVIVQTPIYPPFVSSVKHRRRRLLENRLRYEDGVYRIDFEDFERCAQEASLFLFCSPHNPTGRAWRHEEIERLVDICVAHGVTIVSDEIHADIVYNRMHRSVGSFVKAQAHTVVLHAPSKTFNVAGLNTSFAIIPDVHLRRAYTAEQSRSGITNGNPFGIEALIAAYEDGDTWLEALREHLKGNIDYVSRFFRRSQLPIVPVPTEATFLMWLDCTQMGLSQDGLVDFFVNKAKLGLNNGLDFGSAGEGFMRLNIGTARTILETAMQQLADAYGVER